MILSFVIHHTLIDLIMRNPRKKLHYFLWSVSRSCALLLKILNVKVVRHGLKGPVTKRLIVSNHLSYLDVLVLASEFPSFFITSVEIRETFLLGRICKLAGCFFVERRKQYRSIETKQKELLEMKERLERGFNVFLFPEGTSSDGTSVLPFKGTFFQLSIDTDVPIVPISLKYLGEDRSLAPWYGDMTFIDHLFYLCHSQNLTASVSVLPEMSGNEKMKLANQCHAIIREEYEKP